MHFFEPNTTDQTSISFYKQLFVFNLQNSRRNKIIYYGITVCIRDLVNSDRLCLSFPKRFHFMASFYRLNCCKTLFYIPSFLFCFSNYISQHRPQYYCFKIKYLFNSYLLWRIVFFLKISTFFNILHWHTQNTKWTQNTPEFLDLFFLISFCWFVYDIVKFVFGDFMWNNKTKKYGKLVDFLYN